MCDVHRTEVNTLEHLHLWWGTSRNLYRIDQAFAPPMLVRPLAISLRYVSASLGQALCSILHVYKESGAARTRISMLVFMLV